MKQIDITHGSTIEHSRVPEQVVRCERSNGSDEGLRVLSSDPSLDHQNTLSNISGDNRGTNLPKSLGSFATNRCATFRQKRLQLRGVTLGRHPS